MSLSFPGREGGPGGPIAFTYRLGPAGPGCAGAPFRDLCAHLASQRLPEDRLVLTTTAVAPGVADSGIIAARRLSMADTRRPRAAPAILTRFVFRGYPALLNIACGGTGFHLPRRDLPLFSDETLDARLFRDAIGTRVLNGQYYPFR